MTPAGPQARVQSYKWRDPLYKKGCTGKVWYRDMPQAIHSINRIHSDGIEGSLQGYKCNHCTGFHLTGSKVKLWRCPVKNGVASYHEFKQHQWFASCNNCGLHGAYRRINLLDKWWLKKLLESNLLDKGSYKYLFTEYMITSNSVRVLPVQYDGLFKHLIDLARTLSKN